MSALQGKAAKSALIACLIICLLTASSCRSTRSLTGNSNDIENIDKDWFERINDTSLKTGTVSAKIKLELNADGKKQDIGGSCNLQRDKIIQLSLVAFGFIEVGRLEITPDYLMIVNRMQREYVKVSFDDVPYLTDAGINFHNLQSLFWADLFVTDNDSACSKDNFISTKNGSQMQLVSTGFPTFTTQFTVSLATGLLSRTAIIVPQKKSTPLLEWRYEHYAEIKKDDNQKYFPDKINLAVMGGGNNPTAKLSLSNLKCTNKQIEPSKEPGGKYKQIDANKILKTLMK